MKIKDILVPIDSMKTKIHTAYRISHCTPQIKKAIKQWKIEDDLPVVTIRLEESEEKFVELSAHDLVNLYGFQELPALLMLDDLIKAQERNDKGRIKELLGLLVYGKHEVRAKISPEVFEHIKKNNPEVLEAYQKICNNSAKREKELEAEFSKIVETDL